MFDIFYLKPNCIFETGSNNIQKPEAHALHSSRQSLDTGCSLLSYVLQGHFLFLQSNIL
jgi:hypothetical protein